MHRAAPEPSSTPPPTDRTCRECGAEVGAEELRAVKRRLLAKFPGMSVRWAYCSDCAVLVEDLLTGLGKPAAARRARKR